MFTAPRQKHVIKRNGIKQAPNIAKISERINNVAFPDGSRSTYRVLKSGEIATPGERYFIPDAAMKGLKCLSEASIVDIAVAVMQGLSDNIKTSELDDLAVKAAAPMGMNHYHNDELAARIIMDNHIKNAGLKVHTHNTYIMSAFKKWYECIDSSGNQTPQISPTLYAFVIKYCKKYLAPMMEKCGNRDYSSSGMELFYKTYSRVTHFARDKSGAVIPSKQYPDSPNLMWLRVALSSTEFGAYTPFKTHNDKAIYRDAYDILFARLHPETIAELQFWIGVDPAAEAVERHIARGGTNGEIHYSDIEDYIPTRSGTDSSFLRNGENMNIDYAIRFKDGIGNADRNRAGFKSVGSANSSMGANSYIANSNISNVELINFANSGKSARKYESVVNETYRGMSINWKNIIRWVRDYSFADSIKLQTIIDSHKNTWDDILQAELEAIEAYPIHEIQATIAAVKSAYELYTAGYCTVATPALMSSGSLTPQYGSCYLHKISSDTFHGIFNYMYEIGMTSKYAGGNGSTISNIRPLASHIRSTNGISNGTGPMLKVADEISLYIDQGGGKRAGSHAVYIEPWHVEIEKIIDMKKFKASRDNDNARDADEKNAQRQANTTYGLYYAIWIPDEFMRCVIAEIKAEQNGTVGLNTWYLMDVDTAPGLDCVYDDDFSIKELSDDEVFGVGEVGSANFIAAGNYEFTRLYRQYVRDGRYIRKVSALKLFKDIIRKKLETGQPYMKSKDAANRKSNQKNIGVIKSSNLCAEIDEVSSYAETAACNLASICVSQFIGPPRGATRLTICKSGNRLIIVDADALDVISEDIDFDTRGDISSGDIVQLHTFEAPPLMAETSLSVLMGINGAESVICGVNWLQLARTVCMLVQTIDHYIETGFYPTPKARKANELRRPMAIGVQGLADALIKMRMPYDSAEGRQLASALYEFIQYVALLTGAKMVTALRMPTYVGFKGSPASQGILCPDMWGVPESSRRLDWTTLSKIAKKGLRNSLYTAQMPTGSTSTLMGNSPSMEPLSSLVTKRCDPTQGESILYNKQFCEDMMSIYAWSPDLLHIIGGTRFSGFTDSGITCIPKFIQELYKTRWDIDRANHIDMCVAISQFVDQSMSMNVYTADSDINEECTWIIREWKKGMKTLSYYTEIMPAIGSTGVRKMDVSSYSISEEVFLQKLQKVYDGDNLTSSNGSAYSNDLADSSSSIPEVEQDAIVEHTAISATTEPSGPVCSRENKDCLACGS